MAAKLEAALEVGRYMTESLQGYLPKYIFLRDCAFLAGKDMAAFTGTTWWDGTEAPFRLAVAYGTIGPKVIEHLANNPEPLKRCCAAERPKSW